MYKHKWIMYHLSLLIELICEYNRPLFQISIISRTKFRPGASLPLPAHKSLTPLSLSFQTLRHISHTHTHIIIITNVNSKLGFLHPRTMTGSCNDSTQPFAKTICSICYEDLKPTVEDLQAISICGHVFHELCIQQWFEYCSKGKKKCPICKQTCSAVNVSRLYFQSVGDSNDCNLSQRLQTHTEDSRELEDPKELKLEVRRLEGKVNGLSLALESRENDLKNISNELCVCKEQLKKEASLKNEALQQTHTINCLLNLKTQELNKSDLECLKLRERNMALAKELAALKLVSDLDLEEDEIVKLASLGNEPNSKDSVDILKKSLVARNKLYNKLIVKCKTLGREEARSRKELEKANERLEKLKKKIQEMETDKEMKDNEGLRAQKASKKTINPSSVLNGVDPTLFDTFISQDTIKDPDIHLKKAKRLRVPENNYESNNKVSVSSYILIDDDEPKVSVSPKFSAYDSVPQTTKTATTDASYLSKNTHETSEHNGVPWHNYTDDDMVFVNENGQDKSLPNIIKEAALPDLNSQEADFCFSAGLIGSDGTKNYLGRWCKKGQGKGVNASLQPTQQSGDLIAVGADGRGGTIKVLKSQNLSSFSSRGSAISAKSVKFGAKASSLQSRGCLQIDHFFSKSGQQ
ncbi:hypothetical protein QVD17_40911 [Tagetes erecta]|uniref:RING-type domain-containing protein n=1 Tax=Tagetes erecta TaxID=13708 RepID=A0AAD8JQD5_TARER|nr:hypothetical protein QVD17_40911 [Tagetes erecta]